METGGPPIIVVLRRGEALILIAHPWSWDKRVLAAIHQALPENLVDLSEGTMQQLGAALDALPGHSARMLLYRSDEIGTPNMGDRQDLLMPTGELNASWTDADVEFLDELAGSLVRSDVQVGRRRRDLPRGTRRNPVLEDSNPGLLVESPMRNRRRAQG
jgi:hypothetical protein